MKLFIVDDVKSDIKFPQIILAFLLNFTYINKIIYSILSINIKYVQSKKCLAQ